MYVISLIMNDYSRLTRGNAADIGQLFSSSPWFKVERDDERFFEFMSEILHTYKSTHARSGTVFIFSLFKTVLKLRVFEIYH